MAQKVLVSLVSDQTIPNVELIKEFKSEIEKYVFISTKQMNQQLSWITQATGINDFEVVEVNAFDANDIEKKLMDYDFGDDYILLNITGGTKLMSLLVNEHFRKIGATIFYLTGHNKEYLKVYPGRGKRNFTLKTKITLSEYLTAYGFDYKETQPYKDYQTAEWIFNIYISLAPNEIKEIFEPIRIRRGKSMEIMPGAFKELLSNAKYDYNKNLSKKDTKYLSGDWFEEFIYYKIKNELQLSDDEIATGLNLKKQNTPNEIDVIFIHNNKLFIIECKTSVFDKKAIMRIRDGKEVEEIKNINLLPEVIYKSDALRGKFGLFANTSIFTLEEIRDEDGKPKERFKTQFKRADLSRITIISKRDVLSEISVIELLKI